MHKMFHLNGRKRMEQVTTKSKSFSSEVELRRRNNNGHNIKDEAVQQPPLRLRHSSTPSLTDDDDNNKNDVKRLDNSWFLKSPMQRLTTPEELELIAAGNEFGHNRNAASNIHNNKRARSEMLIIRHGEELDDEASSQSSLSTVDDIVPVRNQRHEVEEEEEDELLLLDSSDKGETSELFRLVQLVNPAAATTTTLSKEDLDVERYMAEREMTATQERWNALTMIPSPLYCIYFLLAGLWIDPQAVEEVRNSWQDPSSMSYVDGFGGLANDILGDTHGCLSAKAWWIPHSMPALPPMPVVAVAAGIILHAPFSFLYHWKYAVELSGTTRAAHWSRRLDQSMIHIASACMAYATSGSWDFFIANVLYNADCVYRQFTRKVRPRRNKVRLMISIVAYTLPILRRGDGALFMKLWFVFAVSFWLFAKYPVGGWSHSAFHLVISLAPPLMMRAACDLPASQDQMRLAAQCAILME